MYDTTMRNVQHNANKLNKLEEQIASGSKLNRPSDNPVGFTNALTYRNMLNSLSQQRVNMDDGEIYMTALEKTHNSMNNIFVRTRELAVQASTDTVKHEDRLFINMEIRQNLEELVTLAQTKHKDNYMFSGKWTNQPPYELKSGEANYSMALPNVSISTSDPLRPFEGTDPIKIQLLDGAFHDPNLLPPNDNPLAERIIPGTVNLGGDLLEKPYKNTDLDEDHPDYGKPDYEIDYVNGTITLLSERAKAAYYDDTGALKTDIADPPPAMSFEYIYRNSIDMSGEIYRETDNDSLIKVNVNPSDLFGNGSAGQTDAFKEMIHLMQGLWHNEQTEIAEGIDTVDTARTRNLEQQVITGSRMSKVEIVYDRNLDLAINGTDAQSKLESVDLAEAFSQFALADAVYSASLNAAARMMTQSLMNYL
jgi:flagellar hook-associated protein 3 FlgL